MNKKELILGLIGISLILLVSTATTTSAVSPYVGVEVGDSYDYKITKLLKGAPDPPETGPSTVGLGTCADASVDAANSEQTTQSSRPADSAWFCAIGRRYPRPSLPERDRWSQA